MDALIEFLSSVLSWLLDAPLYVLKHVLAALVTAFAEMLSLVPVPDFLESAAARFAAVPVGVAWFLAAFEVKFGLGVMAFAYMLRFAIRRIPFFG
jgi:hypothetical protein